MWASLRSLATWSTWGQGAGVDARRCPYDLGGRAADSAVKIYEKGVLNEGVLAIMLNNTRTPDMNRADLMALVAGCRTASTRVRELCDRFGRDTYLRPATC